MCQPNHPARRTPGHYRSPHGDASTRRRDPVLLHSPAGSMLPNDLLGPAPGRPLQPATSVEGDLEGPEGQELVRGGVRGARAEVSRRVEL
jgi:hypothetical protein